VSDGAGRIEKGKRGKNLFKPRSPVRREKPAKGGKRGAPTERMKQFVRGKRRGPPKQPPGGPAQGDSACGRDIFGDSTKERQQKINSGGAVTENVNERIRFSAVKEGKYSRKIRGLSKRGSRTEKSPKNAGATQKGDQTP